ncbi:serine/arginine repetitive matrix protein 2-like [Pseudopipra pipra]|uniref:serine/arginine repetitive matrix protein 2-like n=1 Tax=Pseudopipra pipra TaxID=415032 RepID=UPI003138B4DA
MASETDGNCSICQDTQKDVASALPCHHRFCRGCILRWTHINPVCPLCRRMIETVRFSDDSMEIVITAPDELPDAISQAGTAPDGPQGNSPHSPVASHPSSSQWTPPQAVGGVLPDLWAELFRRQQQLLDPLRPWLRRRLETIYGDQWWLARNAQSSILHALCVFGPDEEIMVQRLQDILEEHTVPLVQDTINIIVGQCSEEARRLLRSHAAGDEDNSPAASTSSSNSSSSSSIISSSNSSFSSSSTSSSNSSSSCSNSREGTPTSSPAVSVQEEEAGTMEAFPPRHHNLPHPVPVPAEQDQRQEELGQAMTVAGPSAQGSSCSPSSPSQGTDHSPRGPQYPPKRRALSSQDIPQPSKRSPRRQQ